MQSVDRSVAAHAPLAIVYRPLASLKPYVRNARTHSPEQLAKLAESLATYGWTNPILVAGDDILAGHARHQAARAMAASGRSIKGLADPLIAPTVDLSHLSAAERRAYIIADNRLAEDAGWDFPMLRAEFATLRDEGFDLPLTGFEPDEIAPLLLAPRGDAAEDEPDRELSAEEDGLLDVAWQRCIGEWSVIVSSASERAWVTSSYTKGVLCVLYVRSRLFGDDIPRGATLAYTPHRLATIGDKGALGDAFSAALAEDGRSVRNSIRWALAEKPSLDKITGAMSLPIHGHRMPGDFPALLARDLIDEFCPAGGSLLDPCHGWGGRALGFLLSGATHYRGFDPSPETSGGVRAMLDDLIALTLVAKRATLHCMPFERAKLKPCSFDFALTSPPYFDTERYDGEASSWRLYACFDDWVAGFYTPLLALSAAALKPGGVFCLQVGSQRYPLVESARALSAACGFVLEDVRHTAMVNNRAKTAPDEGEVIVVLRRL